MVSGCARSFGIGGRKRLAQSARVVVGVAEDDQDTARHGGSPDDRARLRNR